LLVLFILKPSAWTHFTGDSGILKFRYPYFAIECLFISCLKLKGGKLKALGVTTPKRMSSLPEVPTIAEAGLSGFSYTLWGGLFAPAGTPTPIIEQLHADIAKALSAPDVRASILNVGQEPGNDRPEQLAAFVKAEVEKWRAVVKISGARAE
jgi:tripartite-type tricarboxylate transporter receptor subunit TctC